MRRVGEVTYTDAHVRSGEGKGEVCFKDRKGLYRAMKKLQKTKLAGKKIKLKIVVSVRFICRIYMPDLSAGFICRIYLPDLSVGFICWIFLPDCL